MFHEITTLLRAWQPWDTAIVLTGALAAMSCALPGLWLVLRRQSMMGDALAHTALPGVVAAFFFAHWMRTSGWISGTVQEGLVPVLLVVGAVVLGVLTAVLTEWIRNLGRVESGAALGVVFTSLFALGLLLVRLKADDVHIDPDCVLFGQLELVVWDTLPLLGREVPLAALKSAGALAINLLLLGLFYKELRISTFDPELASSLGINARLVNYLVMAVTAITVVMAFESVGSILVIGLLIVPAAAAILLCERLSSAIALTLVIAMLSAVLGHVLAKTVPPILFSRLGFPQVRDAGTAGMISVACGVFFIAAFLLSPQNGLVGKWFSRMQLSLRIAADDVLAVLYRFEEQSAAAKVAPGQARAMTPWITPLIWRATIRRLSRKRLIRQSHGHLQLTERGREAARTLVRSHRLWESYMQKHFALPDDHLHESAHYVEHFLDQDLRGQLEKELDSPGRDPHGREIPGG